MCLSPRASAIFSERSSTSLAEFPNFGVLTNGLNCSPSTVTPTAARLRVVSAVERLAQPVVVEARVAQHAGRPRVGGGDGEQQVLGLDRHRAHVAGDVARRRSTVSRAGLVNRSNISVS